MAATVYSVSRQPGSLAERYILQSTDFGSIHAWADREGSGKNMSKTRTETEIEKLKARTRGGLGPYLALLSVYSALAGCADFSQNTATQTTAPSPEATEDPIEYIEVDSAFLIGSQCPFGSIPAPEPVLGGLWDCEESGLARLVFREAPPTLQFLADCKKRLLTVRSPQNQTDLTWQVLPDGRFVIPVDKFFSLELSEDRPGLGPCQADSQLVVSGQMNCADIDRPEIQVDVLWYLAPDPIPSPSESPAAAPTPAPSPSATPSPSPSVTPSPLPLALPSSSGATRGQRLAREAARACTFSKSCFVHVPHRFKQCP